MDRRLRESNPARSGPSQVNCPFDHGHISQSVLCLDDLEMTSELPLHHLCITFASPWNHLGIQWEYNWNDHGMTLELPRNYLGIT